MRPPSSTWPGIGRSAFPRFLYLLLLICPATALRAQASPRAALDRAFAKGDLMVALSTEEWHPNLALTAGEIAPGEHLTLALAVEAGERLVLIASTDARGDDVDLYVRDDRGLLLHADTENDGTPVLAFTPGPRDSVFIQVHLVACDRKRKFVSLALLSSRGVPLAKLAYRQSTRQYFRNANDRPTPRPAGTPPYWSWWLQPVTAGGATLLRGLPPVRPGSRLRTVSFPATESTLFTVIDEDGRQLAIHSKANTDVPAPDGLSNWGVFYENRRRVPGFWLLGLY